MYKWLWFQCEKLNCLWSNYDDLVEFVFYFFSDICLQSFGGTVNCSLVCTVLETKWDPKLFGLHLKSSDMSKGRHNKETDIQQTLCSDEPSIYLFVALLVLISIMKLATLSIKSIAFVIPCSVVYDRYQVTHFLIATNLILDAICGNETWTGSNCVDPDQAASKRSCLIRIYTVFKGGYIDI